MHNLTLSDWPELKNIWTWPADRQESVAVPMALGRVLAEPAVAQQPVPPTARAAAAGIAVAAAATGADVYLRLGVDAHLVEAGQPLPPGTDTVLGELDYSLVGQSVWVVDAFPPGQGVRPAGAEMAAGELVLPAGVTLDGPALVACQATGLTRVQVVRRPRVAIFPLCTGNGAGSAEAGSSWRTGTAKLAAPPDNWERQPDLMSLMLAAAAQDWGAEPLVNPLVQQPGQLAEQLAMAARTADLLAVIADDRACGAALDLIEDKPCLWLPADATGLRVAAWRWLRAMLADWYGQRPAAGTHVLAALAQPIAPDRGGCLLLAALVGSRYVAWPLPGPLGHYRGAVAANAVFAEDAGASAGDVVPVELLEPLRTVRRTVLLAAPASASDVQPPTLAGERRIHLLTLGDDDAAGAAAAGLVHGRLRGEPGAWWVEPANGVPAEDLHRLVQESLPEASAPAPAGWAR